MSTDLINMTPDCVPYGMEWVYAGCDCCNACSDPIWIIYYEPGTAEFDVECPKCDGLMATVHAAADPTMVEADDKLQYHYGEMQ